MNIVPPPMPARLPGGGGRPPIGMQPPQMPPQHPQVMPSGTGLWPPQAPRFNMFQQQQQQQPAPPRGMVPQFDPRFQPQPRFPGMMPPMPNNMSIRMPLQQNGIPGTNSYFQGAFPSQQQQQHWRGRTGYNNNKYDDDYNNKGIQNEARRDHSRSRDRTNSDQQQSYRR